MSKYPGLACDSYCISIFRGDSFEASRFIDWQGLPPSENRVGCMYASGASTYDRDQQSVAHPLSPLRTNVSTCRIDYGHEDLVIALVSSYCPSLNTVKHMYAMLSATLIAGHAMMKEGSQKKG